MKAKTKEFQALLDRTGVTLPSDEEISQAVAQRWREQQEWLRQQEGKLRAVNSQFSQEQKTKTKNIDIESQKEIEKPTVKKGIYRSQQDREEDQILARTPVSHEHQKKRNCKSQELLENKAGAIARLAIDRLMKS